MGSVEKKRVKFKIDKTKNIEYQNSNFALSQPLTSSQDHTRPPPLPPRGHSFKPSTLVHNLTASFRRRNHTIDLPATSTTSQTEDELRLEIGCSTFSAGNSKLCKQKMN